MKTYMSKTGGGLVKAIRLTEAMTRNAAILKEMPAGFKVLSRVGSAQGKFQFRGCSGNLGDWFLFDPAPGNSHFLAHEHFEAQFNLEPFNQQPEPQPRMMKDPQANALAFEIAVKELIAEHMPKGLTVTEAVGTLQLCMTDISIQFITNTQ